MVCRLAVLGGWTSLVIQGLPRLGTAWPTSTPWGPSWRTPIHPPADDVCILVCSAVGRGIIGVRKYELPGTRLAGLGLYDWLDLEADRPDRRPHVFPSLSWSVSGIADPRPSRWP